MVFNHEPNEVIPFGEKIVQHYDESVAEPFSRNQANAVEECNSTSRYLDDLLNINNPYFEGMCNQIHPPDYRYQFNKANALVTEAPFWIYIYLFLMVLFIQNL